MDECACPYSKARIAGAKKLYREFPSLEEFLRQAVQAGFLADKEATLRDGAIYVTKHHCHQHADKAQAGDFVKHACHCGWAKGTREKIPATFCLCGAGYYRQFFEQVLGRDVKVQVVKSVLRGDRECVIAVYP